MKLKGIKVLDLSLFLPGPMITQIMADHGADVIKVEPLSGGEPNRKLVYKTCPEPETPTHWPLECGYAPLSPKLRAPLGSNRTMPPKETV